MKTMFTIAWKEILETLRDRRTVFNSLVLGPFLMPVLMMGMMTLMIKQETDRVTNTLELPVSGAHNAPNLIAFLESQDVEIKPAPEDAERAIRDQEFDVIMQIPKGFGESWRAGKPATLEIIHDSARREAGTTVSRLKGLLRGYERQVGAMRLMARGVSPTVGTPLAIAERDVATPESRMGMILGFLPYILILGGFLGGAYLAMDTTAGERERQSLEPLLATPVARGYIMSGKLLATCAFALTALFLTLVMFKISFLFFPSEKLGFKLDLSAFRLFLMFIAIVPVAVFGSALLTLLSAFSKSVREAQSYMGLLMLLPMLPTIFLMVSPIKTKLWMLMVPFLGQNQMLMMILKAETITAMDWFACLGGGLGLSAILWFIAARLYHREQLAISA